MKVYRVMYEIATKEYVIYIVAPTMGEADVLFTNALPNQTILRIEMICDKVLNYWHKQEIV